MIFRSGYLALGIMYCVMAQSAAATDRSIKPTLTPMGHTFFCLRYPVECQITDAKPTKPLDPSEQQRQLRAVNAEVNAAITEQEDDSGPADRNWFIRPKRGDCDDYAVTKRHELLRRGWSSSELLLAEVVLRSNGKHHLLLVARDADTDWVLDSRSSQVMRLADMRPDYEWLRVETTGDPRYWNKALGELSTDED